MHSSRAFHHTPAQVSHQTDHSTLHQPPSIIVRQPRAQTTGLSQNEILKYVAGSAAALAVIGGLYAGYRAYRKHRAAHPTTKPPAASPYHSAEQQLDRKPQDEYVNHSITVSNQSINRAQSIKAILFDLDGTLVESSQIWFDLLNAAAKNFGYPSISYDAWKGTFGQSMEKNVELFMVGLDQNRFNQFCDEHYVDFIDHLHILDGTIDLLTMVKQQYNDQLIITTNCPRNITAIILDTYKLTPYFKHIVCAGDEIDGELAAQILRDKPDPSTYQSNGKFVLRPKPSADIIDYSCYLLNINSEDAIFVGDSKFDMISAHKANCLAVGIGIKTGDCFANNARASIKVFERLQQERENV